MDAHHIEHWADGGETKLGNLVQLCRRHHRFVHEYGFRIERDDERIRFVRPDGRVVPHAPAPDAVEAEHGWLTLRRAHGALGVHIDARTGSSAWTGERMDYSMAVGALQRRVGRRPALR